jgi:DNA polymerase-3 subunit alpha
VDTYIACKHGKQKIAYPLPQLEPILSETNGVILYQEQVMQIAQVLAGYTLGQADMLRRAMGKKKPEEMAKQRQVFMEGAEKNKVPVAKAEQIFDLMEKFAGYGFNKSHSAAYALIAYQTAYLKAHFPQAFMAATLSCDMGNSDKVQMLIADCRAMEIDLLPPDINASDWEFVPEGDAIRYGLGAVKGVGQAAVAELVEAREKDGPFASFEDMYMRMPPRVLNKRMLEALIKAGALSPLIPHPNAALQGLGKVLEDLGRKRREQEARQSALFEVAEPSGDESIFGDAPRWGLGECLQAEREVLGFYLTGHPLEEYLGRVNGMTNTNLAQASELPDGAKAVLPIGVSSVRVHRGAKGAMAFVQIEDLHASAEMVCFAKLYGRVAEYLDGEQALLAAVRVDRSRGELSLIAEDIVPIESVLPELVRCVSISSSAVCWGPDMVEQCRQLVSEHPGNVTLAFHVRMADGSIADLTSPCGLQWNTEVRQQLESWFGMDALQLQCRPWQPGQEPAAGSKQEERIQHAA